MPDCVIKVINDWGKSQKNSDFKDKLEFWDRMKQKFDQENEDLDVSDGKVEVEPASNYPRIPVEIPGVRLESGLQPENGDVQAELIPPMLYLAAATCANTGLVLTPMVSQANRTRW